MVEFFRAVIQHCHNVGVVVFVVIIERVEEHSQPVPLVRGPKYVSIVVALLRGEPDSQPVRADPASAGNAERNVDLPPVEVGLLLRPYGTFLALQRRGHSHAVRAGDRVCEKQIKTPLTFVDGCDISDNETVPTCHNRIGKVNKNMFQGILQQINIRFRLRNSSRKGKRQNSNACP